MLNPFRSKSYMIVHSTSPLNAEPRLGRLRASFITHASYRRADMQPVRPTSGDPWAPGAIGNADWTGAPLVALLRAAGAPEAPSLHVASAPADEVEMPDEGRFNAGVSIP